MLLIDPMTRLGPINLIFRSPSSSSSSFCGNNASYVFSYLRRKTKFHSSNRVSTLFIVECVCSKFQPGPGASHYKTVAQYGLRINRRKKEVNKSEVVQGYFCTNHTSSSTSCCLLVFVLDEVDLPLLGPAMGDGAFLPPLSPQIN